MKINQNVAKPLFTLLPFLSVFLLYKGYIRFIYEGEMHNIESSLNEIPNAEVVSIWGHDDVTLEEISTRVRVKGKGEIVLNDLSKDASDYPSHIKVSEIGGLSFTKIFQDGYGFSIDIGTESAIGKEIGITFNAPSEVIEHYDEILAVIKKMNVLPETNYFEYGNSEYYILINNRKRADIDPMFALLDAEKIMAYSKKLSWKSDDSQ